MTLTERQAQRIVMSTGSLFLRPEAPASELERARDGLKEVVAWARGRNDLLGSDALWQLRLCHSRLGRHSAAADAAIELRESLERARFGIGDAFDRAGIFRKFPHLFPALCEDLYQAERTEDLLEAIESSKGRVIADRLTEDGDEPVADPAIYRAVARLPELTARHGFHYVSYFVDACFTYAVLVDKAGTHHRLDRIPVGRGDLGKAVAAVNPGCWGMLDGSTGVTSPDASERLAPSVAWMTELFDAEVLHDDDHLCYSPDDDLANVPLHYLKLGEGRVVDRLSVSRVHSAFQLARVLDSPRRPAPRRFAGYAAPGTEDREKPGWEEILGSFEAPIDWLDEHLEGEHRSLESATLDALLASDLTSRVVHLSTHGDFPKKAGSPYRESFLLFASERGLPVLDEVLHGSREGALTPEKIIERSLDLTGSHVSLMACISGLAREGIGGDALGLDWALIQAGATSLLASHWPVSARRAARFFELFYESWIANGESRATAFRHATRAMLGSDPTPEDLFGGAAFSLGGDFR